MMRRADLNDLEKIYQIIEETKIIFKNEGIDQWQNGTPNKESIKENIKDGGYVYEENGLVLGFCYLQKSEDKNYRNVDGDDFIYDDYFIIHRFCVDPERRREHIATKFFNEIEEYAKVNNFKSIRLDTHKDNIPMRNFIKKNNFEYRGIIMVDDVIKKAERMAFEKKL
ncbi:MAG: GNAT family N-acetyltransferase [Peptoniphilaceae bacterium]|nr:GNAT family N-acetyltransferase [Peptoniphilaceae bacterium]MDD7383044.1 GNAT family N-acetyltransferase [Peptoniphilaceae bacterium]MDY3737552.1 GNAT family N-acetyltransferase [Peptoniphilaceae bacterium]